MQLNDFKLERYFAKYEFNVEYLLSPSDCESLSLPELLEYADPDGKELWANLKLGYTESKGHPALREEIARLYREISAEDVLVLTPEEGIFIALNTILRPGDSAVVVDPAYQSLQEIPRSLGCKVTPWPIVAGNGQWTLDLNRLEDSIDNRTRLLAINFPHNPTGFLPSRELFAGILDLVRRHDLYLLSDEMYWLSEHHPADRLPAVADAYEKGVSLFGLSKTFGLPGLRIGWLATRGQALMDRFASMKDYTTICGSAPSEVLAIIGLRAKERLIARSREIILRNRDLAEQFFAEHPESFRWFAPQAGSTAFPELTRAVPVEAFCEDVVLTKNLMILPGTVFDAPGNHFRVGLGRQNFPQALARLGEYLRG
ncbi:aspartate/methionine/tyrosine aminotransferase [Hydrogenispora ethanolica]|uniref:Aminotransferase n=1 Tax=Hydrogenispora ethanolica TaxID=1082276 RepID=A0A4R1S6Q6_HYDET|nr:aminotransferase class I/II-fold pyridoxal phosphate-dependent enzyme [Hydrogenispora ethanolica]TCL74132.1 aspartate/methionine/tyrosine aminotransferase [Hydrogenispora ethanolica]